MNYKKNKNKNKNKYKKLNNKIGGMQILLNKEQDESTSLIPTLKAGETVDVEYIIYTEENKNEIFNEILTDKSNLKKAPARSFYKLPFLKVSYSTIGATVTGTDNYYLVNSEDYSVLGNSNSSQIFKYLRIPEKEIMNKSVDIEQIKGELMIRNLFYTIKDDKIIHYRNGYTFYAEVGPKYSGPMEPKYFPEYFEPGDTEKKNKLKEKLKVVGFMTIGINDDGILDPEIYTRGQDDNRNGELSDKWKKILYDRTYEKISGFQRDKYHIEYLYTWLNYIINNNILSNETLNRLVTQIHKKDSLLHYISWKRNDSGSGFGENSYEHKLMKLMLEIPNLDINNVEMGTTALHHAIKNKKFSTLYKLILKNKKVNINSFDSDELFDDLDDTPLHLSTKEKDMDLRIIELLKHSRIQIDVKNKEKKTPLYTAIDHKNYKYLDYFIDFMIKIEDKWTLNLVDKTIKYLDIKQYNISNFLKKNSKLDRESFSKKDRDKEKEAENEYDTIRKYKIKFKKLEKKFKKNVLLMFNTGSRELKQLLILFTTYPLNYKDQLTKINDYYKDGTTILLKICNYNNLKQRKHYIEDYKKILDYLLKIENIDVNKPNPNSGNTPLMTLVNSCRKTNIFSYDYEGFVLMISKFLKHKDILVNLKNNNGDTALMIAIRDSDKLSGIINALLNNSKIDINIVNNAGETALMIALKRKKSNIVKLIKKKENHKLSMKELENRDFREYLLHTNSEKGYYKEVEKILDLFNKGEIKIDINYQPIDKKTALHRASENGHKNIIKLFLRQKDIDINREDIDGNIPFIYFPEFIDEIIDSGKKIQINKNFKYKNYFGTILHHYLEIILNEDKIIDTEINEVIKKILKLAPDLNIKDDNEKTVIEILYDYDLEESIKSVKEYLNEFKECKRKITKTPELIEFQREYTKDNKNLRNNDHSFVLQESMVDGMYHHFVNISNVF